MKTTIIGQGPEHLSAGRIKKVIAYPGLQHENLLTCFDENSIYLFVKQRFPEYEPEDLKVERK